MRTKLVEAQLHQVGAGDCRRVCAIDVTGIEPADAGGPWANRAHRDGLGLAACGPASRRHRLGRFGRLRRYSAIVSPAGMLLSM